MTYVVDALLNCQPEQVVQLGKNPISFVLAAALTPDARLSAPDVTIENMKLEVTEEYKDFGDVASGLRFFVE
nr:hypothetical protein [Tanacetum cinerariifolium]